MCPWWKSFTPDSVSISTSLYMSNIRRLFKRACPIVLLIDVLIRFNTEKDLSPPRKYRPVVANKLVVGIFKLLEIPSERA